ncbi:hypothetical protein CP10139811_1324 [Chlamydia ibidis]|uniref:Uncharacterized protein n=1 Tax=Chlamydia ibidis TaxID=1405396 RepID=S7KKP0_9CHLA|nr:hypothetical protein CP061683_1817 [Chlamydia psittaci 06-1683]EPP29831.1 hypothetical protein CP082626L3_1684 [Chlamydia psittaci 08-2626_L3]EPP35010.1 hypothetical protein CP10139811_1324 [Chlamydia ibidis]EPP35810.1 hypothetical protein CP10743SC13_1286 [Chlamydia psittaci 10_743_SC13]
MSLIFIFNFFYWIRQSIYFLFLFLFLFLHFRGFNLKKNVYIFFYSFVRAFLSVCVCA